MQYVSLSGLLRRSELPNNKLFKWKRVEAGVVFEALQIAFIFENRLKDHTPRNWLVVPIARNTKLNINMSIYIWHLTRASNFRHLNSFKNLKNSGKRAIIREHFSYLSSLEYSPKERKQIATLYKGN